MANHSVLVGRNPVLRLAERLNFWGIYDDVMHL